MAEQPKPEDHHDDAKANNSQATEQKPVGAAQPEKHKQSADSEEAKPSKIKGYFAQFKEWWRDPFRDRPSWTDIAIVLLTVGIVYLAWDGGRQTKKIISAANLIESHQHQIVLDNKQVLLDNRIALKSSLDENRRELANALAENRDALEAQTKTTIDAMQVDQRAWVGLADFETIGGSQSEDRSTFSYKSVQMMIRNSGKTPAINLSAVIMQTSLLRDDPIGDYDFMASAFNKKREEMGAKLEADEIRRNPQMAEHIKQWNRDRRALESRSENELFPAGQVLAPGVGITQGAVGVSYGGMNGPGAGRKTVYIFGKITYSDVFPGTKTHTTEFCLMRAVGDRFTICPKGNRMD